MTTIEFNAIKETFFWRESNTMKCNNTNRKDERIQKIELALESIMMNNNENG